MAVLSSTQLCCLPQVHRSADPQRVSAAASVLKNIHYHPDNATTLYKAELKLKHAALMQLKGKCL